MQFAGARALRFRVTKVDQRPTYLGWVWLSGYVLGERSVAVEKREIFVCRAGLRPAMID